MRNRLGRHKSQFRRVFHLFSRCDRLQLGLSQGIESLHYSFFLLLGADNTMDVQDQRENDLRYAVTLKTGFRPAFRFRKMSFDKTLKEGFNSSLDFLFGGFGNSVGKIEQLTSECFFKQFSALLSFAMRYVSGQQHDLDERKGRWFETLELISLEVGN